ncbi:MazG-like family protein [Alkalicoccobacillus porphyridii]|nr:MazG-like family protein [Alkalicoccobacillus porphyridii]
MKDTQEHYQRFQEEMGFDQFDRTSYKEHKMFLLYIHMLLTTEVAEIAEEFRHLFKQTETSIREGKDELEAFEESKKIINESLGKELADCLAYLCKLSNYFDYNLEDELYKKLNEIKEERRQT